MQMRAGYPASRADMTDDRSDVDILVFLCSNPAEVAIKADESLTVIDDDRVAVEIVIAGCSNPSCKRCGDWRSFT